MARVDYYQISNLQSGIDAAIDYIDQQKEKAADNAAAGVESKTKFAELDRVWFQPNESTVWVVKLDKKVKFSAPQHIVTMDIATSGKSLADSLSEEAKKLLAGSIPQKYQVSQEVLREVFKASKLRIDASIEKVYQVFVA